MLKATQNTTELLQLEIVCAHFAAHFAAIAWRARNLYSDTAHLEPFYSHNRAKECFAESSTAINQVRKVGTRDFCTDADDFKSTLLLK